MPAHLPPASPEQQLAVLTKLQRIFTEGDFTATYKHALLVALADLAVERGDDNGDELPLELSEIGERFIQLYWRHAQPYSSGRHDALPGVLVQNFGAQAAVITAIADFRSSCMAASPQAAKVLQQYAYRQMLNRVTKTVTDQPIRYLQNFGGGTDAFLYRRSPPGGIRLLPGIAYCLRRFQPLVHQLARMHWADHIRRNPRNRPVLGQADDLESFLFEPSRAALTMLVHELREVDGERCFYCQKPLGAGVDVDHFIPFSLYPRDLTHNFVLAHPHCNRSKSDSLAGLPHLRRWRQRIDQRSETLTTVGLAAGLLAEPDTIYRVAQWAYSSAAATLAQGWLSPQRFEPIQPTFWQQAQPENAGHSLSQG